MKTCVIIPTYNEARAIAGLVREIRQQGLDILVIDDGSSDNTAQLAQDSGAIVSRNPTNQGKGASLIKGFNYALDKGYEAVITMDGDGQHVVEDIPYFIRLAKYSDSAIFIGNRMQRIKNIPLLRLVTNKFMSWFLSRLAKQKIPDTQCGFRLIKQEALRRMRLTTRKYETESEILLKSSRLGFKIESVPIRTVYKGEKSQINTFIDTIRFIRFIIVELWTMKN